MIVAVYVCVFFLSAANGRCLRKYLIMFTDFPAQVYEFYGVLC